MDVQENDDEGEARWTREQVEFDRMIATRRGLQLDMDDGETDTAPSRKRQRTNPPVQQEDDDDI